MFSTTATDNFPLTSGLNQTFSNIDNFLDIANLGDLAKSLEKLKPYSTSDKKLRNP